ncbi:MAG: Flp pilus assembly complex ATPase component TadA, partial [Chloroflexi bacterium]|nr:Flp pilus assembly complex ATPase component TadA [Chloroflexota bacterium]
MTVQQQQAAPSSNDQLADIRSVLIVDDDARFLGRLAPELGKEGMEVAVAYDGTAAMQQIRDTRYDLILIDVMLPGMSGIEALAQIRAMNPHAMVIVMAGKSQVEGLVSNALWSGADGVLHKPFGAQELLELVQRREQEQAELPQIDLSSYDISPEVLELVPEALARKYALLPLQNEEGHLLVAMADPTNLYAIEDLRVRTGLNIRPVRAAYADIQSALMTYYGDQGEIEREIERIAPLVRQAEDEVASRLSAEAVSRTPIARAVELMIRQAVKDKASDIHLEPQEDRLRVRYRIDGVLHDAMTLPKRVHAPMLSRIKVLAHLNIAERRRPQDGQFSIDIDGHPVDIRVATVDTVHGEMAVLRVLDKAVSVRPLEQLGFLPDTEELYKHVIHAPWGILLIAGPTGSGKTSTLYASINQLDRDEKKIITIEDPVEYRFEGI